VRPERILTEEETVKVLALLSDPNLLVLETANRHRRAESPKFWGSSGATWISRLASYASRSAIGAAT